MSDQERARAEAIAQMRADLAARTHGRHRRLPAVPPGTPTPRDWDERSASEALIESLRARARAMLDEADRLQATLEAATLDAATEADAAIPPAPDR